MRTASFSSATGTLTDGAAAVSAIRKAVTKLDEDEVPPEERYLFITPTLHGMIQDTLLSRAMVEPIMTR